MILPSTVAQILIQNRATQNAESGGAESRSGNVQEGAKLTDSSSEREGGPTGSREHTPSDGLERRIQGSPSRPPLRGTEGLQEPRGGARLQRRE